MRKFFIVLFVCVTAINVVVCVCSKSELADLTALKVEVLAADESLGGNGMGPLVKYGCVVTERVIMGYHSDGSPNIQTVAYPGEEGRCAGVSGDCSPYPCTRYY